MRMFDPPGTSIEIIAHVASMRAESIYGVSLVDEDTELPES
jgi:hypothetical protein